MPAATLASWSLPDGRVVTMRPISPDDFDREMAFIDGLSMETGYNRLFSPRHPSPQEVRRWTNVDPRREAAFVVTAPDPQGAEQMLAVGRLVHDEGGADAEFALLVGDASKRQGLGRHLLEALIDEARARDLRTLYGLALSTNADMLALGARCGFASRREIGDSLVTRLSLQLR